MTKKIKPRYDATVRLNRTYNIARERTPDAGMLMPVAMYVPAEIAPDAVTIEDVYGHIPGVIYEDGFFTDANGANVRILFNGYVMYSSSYAELCELVTCLLYTYNIRERIRNNALLKIIIIGQCRFYYIES